MHGIKSKFQRADSRFQSTQDGNTVGVHFLIKKIGECNVRNFFGMSSDARNPKFMFLQVIKILNWDK